ncbi:hypothetical protein NW765_014405 [Fusarium oxysporum]|nr:hypothetical protein NW765_014405 [Fusarium oxysporum]
MDRRSSHASKPSLSKLNVQAPEFKFNPTSSFTPGQFDFGSKSNTFQPGASSFEPAASTFQPGTGSFQPGVTSFQPGASAFRPGASSFQPTGSTFQPTASTFEPGKFQGASFEASGFQPSVFQANTHISDTNMFTSPPAKQPTHVTPAKINVNAPSFSPGESSFSFSTSGPKFNVAAPTFTPHSNAFTSPTSQGHGSIFGSIDLSSSDMQSNKKSKAIPIMRPSSQSSARPDQAEEQFDVDGRPIADENRVKRARSSAPGGDDVPLFAEQPTKTDGSAEETQEATQDDHVLPADTSMSSIVTSDQIDTKATTAAPSAAPSVTSTNENNNWKPFEFDSNQDIQNFNDARPFGEDNFKHEHKKTLSATAELFQPGVNSYGETTQTENEEESDASPVASPMPARAPSGISTSRLNASQPPPRTVSKGLGASRFADPPKPAKGLAASRFAGSPTPDEKPLPPPPC